MTATHDEKRFLELLQPYSSEETRKARRNTSTIGFIVIASWALGVRLNDIHAMGADISTSSESLALTICLLLLAYWSAMFLTSWLRDREIERERWTQGQVAAKALIQRYMSITEQIKRKEEKGYIPSVYHDVKRAFDSYELQRKRTAKARRYEVWITTAEIFIPTIISAGAGIILCVGIWRAL